MHAHINAFKNIYEHHIHTQQLNNITYPSQQPQSQSILLLQARAQSSKPNEKKKGLLSRTKVLDKKKSKICSTES